MTTSPWIKYATTGTHLDYTPIDAPIIANIDETPERPSRLWGWVAITAALLVGAILGGLL